MAAQAIPTQRWVRIIPITFLMYTIAFMDRNNIAFSFSGMQKDLAFAATGSGLAAGIFFFGYAGPDSAQPLAGGGALVV